MSTYIKLYNTTSEQTSDINEGVDKPHVSLSRSEWNIRYIPSEGGESTIQWNEIPLTFEALESGTLTWGFLKNSQGEFSKDFGETWTQCSSDSLTVNAGETISLKAEYYGYFGSPSGSTGIGTIQTTFKFNLYGNPLSIYKKTFENLNPTAYQFFKLFRGSKVVSAKYLYFPNVVAQQCYREFFYGCTNLVEAPVLPATSLVLECYQTMFWGCTSLEIPPALPATTIAQKVYWYMFDGCPIKSIELPAEMLYTDSYGHMFNNCSQLQYIKIHATNTSASNCLVGWVSGVNSSGTIVKKSSVTYPTGVNGIPSGWTVENM